MVTNGILVINIGADDAKSQAQINEFLTKAKLIPNFNLTVVKNEATLLYVKTHHDLDFVLFWDKDLYLAQKLVELGLKVFNSPEAINVCDDKALTHAALDAALVKTPRYFVFPFHYFGNIFDYYDNYKASLLALGFPLVLKERFGSYGDQVYLVHSEAELKNLIKKHGTKKLLAQQFIAKNSGTDYRVNVVGDKVISVIKRSNPHDFRSNINQGGSAVEVEVSDEIKTLAIKATKAVNGHFAGVDIMLDDHDKPVVIEVNSNMRTVSVNKVAQNDMSIAMFNYIVEACKK